MDHEGAAPLAPNGNGHTGVEMSAGIDQLATALAKAQGEIKGAEKDRTNPHFNSKYATLDALWDSVRGPLSAHGLSVVQPITADPGHETLTVTTILLHASGQWIKSALTLTPRDGSPQAAGSAATYGKRYGLGGMVGVTAEEDDDGNAAQGTPAKKLPGYYKGPAPKSLVPAAVIGQPDRPSGPPTSEAEAQEAFPTDAEDRPFMLDACKRKVEGYKLSGKEREALKKLWLGGHAADLAKTADLHRLYLFLGDAEAVAQWRAEFAKAS